jgi:5-dehydro-2-deoxygluconokinase
LRKDETLKHLHWASTRRTQADTLMAFAIDHRLQFEELAQRKGAPKEQIGHFKLLAVEAVARVAGGRNGYGMLLDETYGREAMFEAAKHNLWLGRPVERPGSRPLQFEHGQDVGSLLIEWPITHTVKCLTFFHPDDESSLKHEQTLKLRTLYEAARRLQRELLIEIIAGKHGPLNDNTVALVLEELYRAGIKPDWWKLEPQETSVAWRNIEKIIEQHDPWCRGIVLLGLDAPAKKLEEAFVVAESARMVRGFAIGRTVFGHAARTWFSGDMNDEDAISDMAEKFGQLASNWRRG